jgi:Uma2 family endonuclease
MTAEEFYEFVHLPENEDRFFELDEGKVIELTRPKRAHGIVCGCITAILFEYARRTGRGQVCPNDTGVLVARDPDTVRGPDIAYFANRLSIEDAAAEEGFTEETPLLAVEVLSPSDRPSRVARKVHQYLQAGVKLVWVVDPEVQEVGVHRPGVELEILGVEATLAGGDELPGFECRVAEIFALPGETVAT